MAVRSRSSGSATAQGMESDAKAEFTASISMRVTSVERRKQPRRHSFTGSPCMSRCFVKIFQLLSFGIKEVNGDSCVCSYKLESPV